MQFQIAVVYPAALLMCIQIERKATNCHEGLGVGEVVIYILQTNYLSWRKVF